ncbi:hypothetical protein J5N97_001172 [Dioscorea zingiberensis]|uniref:Uncharacterized protein n=1 Tax=Dioscorea zingiberensis TaxID=325984 RepID=A0A9D5H2G5_9LILI|nr:hypothetical protein J5N97_001172 [Dioscorea zingiberensis]
MPDYFVRTLLTIIHAILPPMSKSKTTSSDPKKSSSAFPGLSRPDDREHTKKLQLEIERDLEIKSESCKCQGCCEEGSGSVCEGDIGFRAETQLFNAGCKTRKMGKDLLPMKKSTEDEAFRANPSDGNRGPRTRTGLSGIHNHRGGCGVPSRRPLKRMSSRRRWEAKQLIASGVLDVRDYPMFDEDGDGMLYQEGGWCRGGT